MFSKFFQRVLLLVKSLSEPDRPETPKPKKEETSAQLRKERAKKLFGQGYTPAEIAIELGVARSTVYTYLEGVRGVSTRAKR